MDVGSAAPLEQPAVMEVRGRHLVTGMPGVVRIADAEIREALAEPVRLIVQGVRDALERVPPELCGDIFERGVVLSGGGSLLKNLDRRLRDETGLPVQMAEDPLGSVVLGAGRMLDDFTLLRKVTTN
jgi:rod shape-determining protein MreB and related proteins